MNNTERNSIGTTFLVPIIPTHFTSNSLGNRLPECYCQNDSPLKLFYCFRTVAKNTSARSRGMHNKTPDAILNTAKRLSPAIKFKLEYPEDRLSFLDTMIILHHLTSHPVSYKNKNVHLPICCSSMEIVDGALRLRNRISQALRSKPIYDLIELNKSSTPATSEVEQAPTKLLINFPKSSTFPGPSYCQSGRVLNRYNLFH